MIFDAESNCLIDTSTGAVIPLQEGDILPPEASARVALPPPPPPIRPVPPAAASSNSSYDADRRLAEQLARSELASFPSDYEDSYYYRGAGTIAASPGRAKSDGGNQPDIELPSRSTNTTNSPAAGKAGYTSILAQFNPRNLLPSSKRGAQPEDDFSYMLDNVSPLENELLDLHTKGGVGSAPADPAQHSQDWLFARSLQSIEFEMADEVLEAREGMRIGRDFNGKEYRASSCRRQFLTLSTLICLVQICLVISMIEIDGFAPTTQNPMYGPPVTTLVRFGAKETGLIVYRKQWWRLFSAIMLHAGVLHLVSNVFIQLRVGGYLNLVYGTPKWLTIYLVSGVFGNLMSCCFLPDSVGVGSSGALLGMLTSWIVWIIYRWKKIPPESRGQRNCQLMIVVVAVAVTLGMSFSSYVDWAAHFGGAVQGLLLALFFLSNELDNQRNKMILRVSSLSASIVLFSVAVWYVATQAHPTSAYFGLWDANDDFTK